MKVLLINNGEEEIKYPSWVPNHPKFRKWYGLRKGQFSMSEKRFPIGLGYLSAMLKQNSHEVHLLDRYADPGIWTDNLDDYEFIGIYASTPLFPDTIKILELLKNRKNGQKIAVGGPHATVFPQTVPNWVDYVVQGEAEYVINGLVEGKWPSGTLLKTPRIKDLDHLPRADYNLFMDSPRSYKWDIPFTDHEPIFLMNTSRSCPYRCSFCDVRDIWGKLWTKQSPERVVADIEYLKNTYDIAGVYFREDIFTADKQRVKEICELLIKKDLGIVWACETRVDCGAYPGMLELMSKAGCRGIYVGAEHFSQKMLNVFNKDIQVEQIIKTCENAKKHNVVVAMSLIINHPEETSSDRKEMKRGLKITKPEIVWKNKYRSEFRTDSNTKFQSYPSRDVTVIDDIPGVWYGQKDRV